MIKRFCIIFAFVFFAISSVATYADVVFGNEFFYENRDKTDTAGVYGRRFVINSPSGYIIPKEEPGSENGIPSSLGYQGRRGFENIKTQHGVFIFENGDIVSLMATYLHEGMYWGIMQPSHMYQPSGWVPMEELLVIYERQDFEAENKDDFYDYTGNYDAVLSAKRLVEWQWPGSDKEKRIIDNKDAILQYADVRYAYRDSDGREWGKAGYSAWWICLSDPENTKIPAFYPAPKPAAWSPDSNPSWSSTNIITYPPQHSQRGEFFTIVSVIIMVIALVAGTATLIRMFRKPNNDY